MPRYWVCPGCGDEFKSSDDLEIHYEVDGCPADDS
jgi:hypothetical protein